MYRLIDLYAGCGGLTLGFVRDLRGARFQSVWAVDSDPAAGRTYETNFGPHIHVGDIKEALHSPSCSIPKADVVIGGPPCQGFSLLNRQRQGDARRGLWQPFLEVVERSGARVFLIENVQGLLTSPEMDEIHQRASAMGFSVSAGIVNAADFGVPQIRRRCVVLGWTGDKRFGPQFPVPTHSRLGGGSTMGRWTTVREAIGDLSAPKGTAMGEHPSPYDLHFGRNVTPVSVMRYEAVPKGGNRFDLQNVAPHLTPRCWKEKPKGGTDIFGRMHWDQPSVTIRTEFWKPEKGRYLHPEQHRAITHREAARLMGFPDDFIFEGSKIEVARQIGNAVAPPVAAAFAQEIASYLDRLATAGPAADEAQAA